jgi:ubiquinone biosynthesis protein Coq4
VTALLSMALLQQRLYQQEQLEQLVAALPWNGCHRRLNPLLSFMLAASGRLWV